VGRLDGEVGASAICASVQSGCLARRAWRLGLIEHSRLDEWTIPVAMSRPRNRGECPATGITRFDMPRGTLMNGGAVPGQRLGRHAAMRREGYGQIRRASSLRCGARSFGILAQDVALQFGGLNAPLAAAAHPNRR
jgi:hypothetical protein